MTLTFSKGSGSMVRGPHHRWFVGLTRNGVRGQRPASRMVPRDLRFLVELEMTGGAGVTGRVKEGGERAGARAKGFSPLRGGAHVRWSGSRASPRAAYLRPLAWFESLSTNGLRCCSGLGLDSRFHGNDGVGPLAGRMVREPHQERAGDGWFESLRRNGRRLVPGWLNVAPGN